MYGKALVCTDVAALALPLHTCIMMSLWDKASLAMSLDIPNAAEAHLGYLQEKNLSPFHSYCSSSTQLHHDAHWTNITSLKIVVIYGEF